MTNVGRHGGHGTLCGALGGASCIINLVAYGREDDIYRQMIDRLFYWYARQEFPTDRFDDISKIDTNAELHLSVIGQLSISFS